MNIKLQVHVSTFSFSPCFRSVDNLAEQKRKKLHQTTGMVLLPSIDFIILLLVFMFPLI